MEFQIPRHASDSSTSHVYTIHYCNGIDARENRKETKVNLAPVLRISLTRAVDKKEVNIGKHT